LLETITTPEGREWTYSYDTKGNQLTAEIPGGAEWDYTYKSLNRLTKSMITMEYPTGLTIDYERNEDGQLTAIRQGMATPLRLTPMTAPDAGPQERFPTD